MDSKGQNLYLIFCHGHSHSHSHSALCNVYPVALDGIEDKHCQYHYDCDYDCDCDRKLDL